jgi:hypothetical protein
MYRVLPQWGRSHLALLTLCLTTLMLSGCQKTEGERAMLDDYAERVARVLDQELDEKATISLPALPPARVRYQATEDLREGVLDVLDFRECQLLHLISERNSILGKVATSSQRLIYELRFLDTMSACIPILERDTETEPEVIERAKAILAQKQADLPIHLWNAWFTGQEIEESLALNQPPLSTEQTLETHNALNALSAYTHLVETALTQNTSSRPATEQVKSIEQWMQMRFNDPLGTPLLRGLIDVTATLNQVANTLNARLDRKPFCYPNMRNPDADILKNVFTAYYAQKVQPYMAGLNRLGESWFTYHSKLLNLLKEPDDFSAYSTQVMRLEAENSLWVQFQSATQKHTKAWQRLLSQCGMMPSR